MPSLSNQRKTVLFHWIVALTMFGAAFGLLYKLYFQNEFALKYLPWQMLKTMLFDMLIISNGSLLLSILFVVGGFMLLTKHRWAQILAIGSSLGFLMTIVLSIAEESVGMGFMNYLESIRLAFEFIEFPFKLGLFLFAIIMVWNLLVLIAFYFPSPSSPIQYRPKSRLIGLLIGLFFALDAVFISYFTYLKF